MLHRTLVPVILIAALGMAAFDVDGPSPGATVAIAGHVPNSILERLARLLPRMSPSRLYRPLMSLR